MSSTRADGRRRAYARPRPTRMLAHRAGYGAAAAVLAVGVGLPLSVVVSGSTPGTTALAATSSNLASNPGFESGSTTGWRTNGSTELLRAVTRPHSGHYSARLTTTKTVTAVLNDRRNSVSSTVKGAAYVARAWIRTGTPKVVGAIKLREVRNGSQVTAAKRSFQLTDTRWHAISVSLTAARAGDSIDFNLDAYSLPKGRNLFADDISIVRASTLSTNTSPSPSPSPQPTTASSGTCSVNAILVPTCGAWWGVASNPLHGESYDQALVNFESEIGRSVDIVHYYHRGTRLFPTSVEIGRATQAGKNRLLLENWKPENGHTWAQVARGASDSLIDSEAAYIKSHFTRRFFLALHGEPERYVNATSGSGFTAADYAAMYRHVILRLRADGAHNIVSVLDLTGLPSWGSKSWFKNMYPGNDVVDWVAEDPYDFGPVGGWYDSNYGPMVNRTFSGYSFPGFYKWAANVAPGKPIMIAEWGVAELSGHPSWKANHFTEIANKIMSTMPRVHALVYWNSNSFNPVGTTRINSSSAALTAYRKLGQLGYLNQPVPRS